MATCLNISNNIISISNNKYIINDISNINTYGLYINDNSDSQAYYLKNIPRNAPLRFFIDGSHNNNSGYDISHIIEVSHIGNPIQIYVSKGNDISFNNGDYFRFYDESFNLININHNSISTTLTNSGDNFYFMNDVSYEFIATTDFSSAFPFSISGAGIQDNSLTLFGNSFIINIPSEFDNINNKIFYIDLCNESILEQLFIAKDNSENKYYYDNIRFTIKPEISNNDISLSIISISNSGHHLGGDISNIGFFHYNPICHYIIDNTNIIANQLSNLERECLNIISKADFSTNINSYEFNVGNHFSGNYDNRDSLTYVISDGTYYIFDICENYPLKLGNSFQTQPIKLANSIQYIYTKERTNNNNETYYYGAIKIKLDNSIKNFKNGDELEDVLQIWDVSDNNIKYMNLIYNNQCNDPSFVNNIKKYNSRFNLINQNYIEFSDNFYQDVDNYYILNIYENYIEPSNNGFIAIDEYGHNLNNLVNSNAPLDLSSILTRTNNYTISNFLITYNLTTYDEQTFELYRYVEINYGPFIEISGLPLYYYKDDNSFNNVININNNLDSPFDLSNINVYLKNGINDRINLKFDIEFLQEQRYSINSTNKNPIFDSNYSILDISYNKKVIFPNSEISGQKYYLSRNLLHFNYANVNSGNNNLFITGSTNINQNPLVLKDISNISVSTDNSNNKILNDEFILSFFDQDFFLKNNSKNYIDYSNIYLNDPNYSFLTLYSKDPEGTFDVCNIQQNISHPYLSLDESFGLIEITQNDSSNNLINTKLYLNDIKFIIDFSFQNISLSEDNITISGDFLSSKIFSNSSIDLSYIGNYQIKIVPLGLDNSDNFYNTNDVSFKNYIQDVSKIYTINVIDDSNPTIEFKHKNKDTSTNDIYNFPRDFSFHLIPTRNNFDTSNSLFFLSDACYNDFIDQNRENSSKPIIVFNDDDSIYNLDLSYAPIYDVCNIKLINNVLTISDNTLDASAVIQYIGIDLCGNSSNDISLTILFKNIPQLSLAGQITEPLEVGNTYIEPGIFIDNSFYNFNDLSLTGSFTDFCNNKVLGSKQYDISFITDLNINQVGVYDISYIVSFSNETTSTFLKRFIKVQDNTPPFILFPDLSSIYYDFSSRNTNDISNTLSSLSDISYVRDKSNNPIIDFSLSLFSNISDLSKIIYDFSLVDNYTSHIEDISVSISLEIISISGNDISSINLITNSLSEISGFLFTNGYVDNNGDFIILTKSNDFNTDLSYYKPELSFNYIIKDICDNSFNFTRKVNIINYDISPNIFFTRDSSAIDDLSNRNIVIYSNSKNDFSYQAHNYKKNPTLFIHEISNILFNFDISDEFSQLHSIDLNNNVLISISYNDLSYNDPSIITFNHLSNLNDNCFNDVSNHYLSISNILEQFAIIDNSFQLIYDFSNNQDLSNSITRDVTIINTISCDISVSFQFPGETDPSTINISFGNIDFSFTKFFTLSHPRLQDISFELSYNASPIQDFSSIIGEDISFDVSALIYQYTDSSNIKSYNFKFYNTISNDSSFISAKLDISVNIKIDPPFLKNDPSLSTIIHPAGTYISDLSLIENVSFFSKFDEFYYANYQLNDISISYSETNFTLSFEKSHTTTSEFNQNFPESDLSGDATYNIIYDVSDTNGTFKRFTRELKIQDKTPPIITLLNQDPIDVEDFLEIQTFDIVGFNVQDSFSYLKTIDYSINLYVDNSLITPPLDICSISFDLISSGDISNNYDISIIYILNFNDISDLANDFSDITIRTSYKATDIKHNSADNSNSITLNFSDLIKLNIAIEYNDNSFNLDEDFYIPDEINWFLEYKHSTQTIRYDASTSDISFIFSVDSSNQDISTNIALNNSIQIIPSIDTIDFTDICNIDLYFQLFYIPNNGGNPIIKTRILNLNIVDKNPPNLSFINNSNFPIINTIKLPEVSYNFILDNSDNSLNLFYDENKSYNYFITNLSNEIIYNIPSIIINDIANGLIELSNNINDYINISSSKSNATYDISISYKQSNIDFSSSALLGVSGNFIQTFQVTENYANTDFSINTKDISRTIIIERFSPIIELSYNKGYIKSYHKYYSLYNDLSAIAIDYVDGFDISLQTIKTNFNENNLGLQKIEYKAQNTNIINNTRQRSRDVHVVDICCLFFDKTENYDISNISNDFDNNIRYGLYGTQTNELSYNFYIDPSLNTYIALKSYKNDIEFDNSNAISINYDQLYTDSSSNVFYNTFDDCSYVKGKVIINVKEDFDRASLYWITIDSSNIIDNSDNFSDLFLYNDSCIYYFIDSNFIDISINDFIEFSVDVSGKNNIDNSNVPYFTISGNNVLSNELTFDPTPRKTLHLPYGIYGFKQNRFKNFYNKIKFSYLPDGCHFNIKDNSNGDISYIYNDFLLYNNYTNVKDISFNNKNDPSYSIYEYTNNVYSNSLAGININYKNSYTYLEINATTPSPLYYYSENFSNMGGIIYTKNNISFSKNCVSLNGNILTINNNNKNIFNNSNFSSSVTNFNEISSNLLFLSCRFDLSSTNTNETNNIILNKDFIALTQQNITHNIIINKDSNRIIFKKYDDISSITNGDTSGVYESINYIIKQDNSNNYLFDSSINFIERYKGNNILLYKFNIETSANFIKNNIINNRLELNALDFFFNNNQLNNYKNFFNKNKLINNIYEKNNNNKNIYFTQDAFKYNINEIAYINQVNLKNGDDDYKFFDNTDLLNSNRLIFEPIFDNLFTFNFQIYLDYNNVSLDPIYKNYLKNNIFNKNIYSNYPNDINVDYLYFDELIVSVISDISGPSTITKDLSQSIIFSENTIFINEPFLNSTNNKNTIDIGLNGIGISSENLIILSGIDISNNTFCGLTQQNFVHNIDISNVNKVIFHKYNSTLFNYQVNNANLTLEKTLLDSSNNNKYFLELSSNDVYNCFIDISESITNTRNVVNKNKLMESSRNILDDPNFSFNSHITYTIYDEIESNNSDLSNFDIRPVNLYEVNELSYNNDISYAYANYGNISNSHSFIINLTDYLDRKFFDNIKINIPSNIINYNNINFIIKDISYSTISKQFNLYDICANQIILYDKTKIATLNNLEAKIHITNLKFEYLKEVYEERHGNSETLTQLINNQSNFINTLNLQNIVTLFNDISFITNTYAIELENNSLNRLYSNVFYNSKLLINRYNELIDAFIFYDYYLLPPTSNIYENIRDFELVNQLVTDISQINFNIDKINQEIEIRTSQDIYNTIQNDISLNRLDNYETLLKLTQFYLYYKERYEIIHYELTLRHDIFTNIDNNLNESNNYNSSFVELFNTYTINEYYQNLINNMINFNNMLLNDISSSVIYNSTEGEEDSSSNKYHNTLTTNTKYNPPDISYLEILAYTDISINFNNILNSAHLKYDFINKESIFDNINYVLNGTSILINSVQSSNILFKIDLIYNSYLFPNKYLDTLILDVVKPDLIPPTIIFNNNDLTINQSDLQSNIDNIIQTLIQDISYIELHESHRDFSVNDISYTYSKVGGDIFYNTTSLIQSNVTIEIDISNIGTNTSDNLEVIYKVIDNANNINIIKRNITFITSINSPNLYYVNPLILPPNINNKINPGSYELPILTVNENLNTNIIIELAKNNIIIQDSSSTIYLTKEDPSFDLMLDITILDASNIRYDLSSLIFPSIQPLVFNRLISTTSEIIEEQKDHCCFPPAFYYPIQHNYTLGQNATYKMRVARFIINNHR